MLKKNTVHRLLCGILVGITLIGNMTLGFAQDVFSGTVNKDKVFFRMKPNTDSEYHAMLNKKTVVQITGESGNFYAVTYDKKNGYIMKSLITLSKQAQKELKKNSKPKLVSKYAKVKTIAELGNPPQNVKFGQTSEGIEKLQRALEIKKSYHGAIDGIFGNGTRDALKDYQKKNKLKVTGRADDATIKLLFGQLSKTTAKEDPKMAGITSISQISVPRITKLNASGRHVTSLQQALKLKGYYTDRIDGKYGASTKEAVEKFQKSKGLFVDGIAGNSTILKLFGKNAEGYVTKTEQLDWFNGGSSLIPKGATFQVKDINSGEVFTVKRWSGYNHLDAEPVNAESAAAIKRAAGGSWSWQRRAVLVKYNGHVYAASMNSMPHEDETISSNNFDGHFCIHFHNSKTHGTNRLDQTHQNAVEKAMKYTW